MSSQTFPGLQPFILSEAQRIGIGAEFALVLSDARLAGRRKDDIRQAIPNTYVGVPGIYFWIMGIGPHLYRIYVGKTKSLERRVADYMKDFQAHSPNDYKIRIFQQAIFEKEPSAGFRLYFKPATLDTYTRLETQAIQRYDPLLNRRAGQPRSPRGVQKCV